MSTGTRKNCKALAAAATMLFGSATLSAAVADEWVATSTAAMGITGDLTISEDRITFEDGEGLSIEPVGSDRPGVFRVDPPANPVLKRGNTLCGDQPVTFVVFGHDEDSADLSGSQDLFLKLFTGSEPPPVAATVGMSDAPRLCAMLNYQRK